MIKNIFVLILSIFILSGCADSFRSYFKRSANDKLIDSKGFHGAKRKPLYNKKYISMAKKNIVEDNIDETLEDDNDETEDPAKRNRRMYLEMMKRERDSKKANQPSVRYPSLTDANKKAPAAQDQNQDLQKELAEIKSMLLDAKQDLAKYKCPINSELDNIDE